MVVDPLPGGDYGVGVYASDPGSQAGPPAYTDTTVGGGQPSTTGTNEWTEWSSAGTPYVCNPQTCMLPLGVPSTPRAVVDPLTVAQELVTGMQIRRIAIGIVPEPDDPPGSRVGLIGMPVWLWDTTLPPDSEHTRGPITRFATVGTLTVSATAVNTAVVWNLGDGGLPVVCPLPAVNNTPYLDVFLDLPPITGCGRFAPGWRKTSIDEPGGQFTVSATSLWVVTWTATSATGTVGGSFPLLPTATTQVRVGEMQVLGAN
ncbi:hypothetical protein AB0N05_37695 [Nocardia sp. NPDC051030]|uniref:hypothetical protein n=1 Tax=Nocardia sp. NPDC051030 TaxID=3155162 RepID=UPI0034149FD5